MKLESSDKVSLAIESLKESNLQGRYMFQECVWIQESHRTKVQLRKVLGRLLADRSSRVSTWTENNLQ